MKKGFSLIELVTTMAIMSVLTVIGVMIYFSIKQDRQITAVADKIKGVIMETRQNVVAFSPTYYSGANKATIVAIVFTPPRTIQIGGWTNAGAFALCYGDTPPLASMTNFGGLDTSIPSNITFDSSAIVYINANDDPSCSSDKRGNYGILYGANRIVLHDQNNDYYHLEINKYGGIQIVPGM